MARTRIYTLEYSSSSSPIHTTHSHRPSSHGSTHFPRIPLDPFAMILSSLISSTVNDLISRASPAISLSLLHCPDGPRTAFRAHPELVGS